MARVNAVNATPVAGAPLVASSPTATERNQPMPQIGQFTHEKSGFVGRIHTLTLTQEVTIVPVEPSDAENAPDYRILHGGDDGAPEIGAGWKRTGEKAGDYVSLLIDDPAFAQPFRANLYQNGGDKTSWSLHWNRQPKRGERE